MLRAKSIRPTTGPEHTIRSAGVRLLAAIAVVCLSIHADVQVNGYEDKPKGETTEAPAAFDGKTNGLFDQVQFQKDMNSFADVEAIEDGLGPVYNATSCAGCHQNPVIGSTSQVSVLRAGHREANATDPSPRKVEFKEPPGGSLIQQRAIDAAIQVHVRPQDTIHTLRMSTNVLGNGYVEVIPDEDIIKIKKAQPAGMRGLTVLNPVVITATNPGPGETLPTFEYGERIGRFGWKCQDSSLLNFAAGAYLNEMGITSPLQPHENTAGGVDVAKYDTVCDPEDGLKNKDDKMDMHVYLFGVDVQHFTQFMRSTKAPPRESSLVGTPDVVAGEKLFKDNAALGCAICHHPEFITPPAGTPILTYGKKQGSDMVKVPEALGNKIIHPYSDFMLHDIGTGDGIAQTQHAQRPPRGAEKREKISNEIIEREGIVRVEASAIVNNQRILKVEPAASETLVLDQRTVNKIRTAPLWGLRVRPQLMHDGLSLTLDDAIRRHKGQAEGVELKYEALPEEQKKQLIAFLKSL
jgi:CxxC motif-containing protein (DUF1111 family)